MTPVKARYRCALRTGGMQVNAAGPHTNVAQVYEGTFKAGMNHNGITVNQAWPLGADAVLSTGEYHVTGKNQSGAAIEAGGFWTAGNVREGGNWKIQLLTAVPKPPEPPK
jgi:hypothetical protein